MRYETPRFSQNASPIRVLFEFYSCSMRPHFVLTSWLLIIQMLKFKIKRDIKHPDFRNSKYYESTMKVL